MCFVQNSNIKIVFVLISITGETISGSQLGRNTFKSTKNRSSHFGGIEEIMDLSCILLAVLIFEQMTAQF